MLKKLQSLDKETLVKASIIAVILIGCFALFLSGGPMNGRNAGLQSIFPQYKNGVIAECPTNGKMFYVAGHNYPDQPSTVFNQSGRRIGSTGGFNPANSTLKEHVDFDHCVTIYSNLSYGEKINKYDLR